VINNGDPTGNYLRRIHHNDHSNPPPAPAPAVVIKFSWIQFHKFSVSGWVLYLLGIFCLMRSESGEAYPYSDKSTDHGNCLTSSAPRFSSLADRQWTRGNQIIMCGLYVKEGGAIINLDKTRPSSHS